MTHLRPHRRKTIFVPRVVRVRSRRDPDSFGLVKRDATWGYLTLGRYQPIIQQVQKDSRYNVWAVTGSGSYRHGLSPAYIDKHLTHISPVI